MGGLGLSMMDEMAKTLARRRAIAEKDTNGSGAGPAPDDIQDRKGSLGKLNGSANNNSSSALAIPAGGGDSPLATRKRSGSSGGGDDGGGGGRAFAGLQSAANGADGCFDLDSFKEDVIREMRLEMNKMKQEIIEGNRYLSSIHLNLIIIVFIFIFIYL